MQRVTGRQALCLSVLLLMIAPAWGASASEGKELFEKRCSACHQLPDPDNPPPEGWENKLQVMARNARLNKTQKAEVLDFLTSHTKQQSATASLEEDRKFFEHKCSHCHTLERIFLEPLTDESRQHVLHRMQAKSGTDWLSDADVERILNYLSAAKLKPKAATPLPDDAAAEDIFAARCSACHSLERIVAKLNAGEVDWSHIVSRMRGKAPQWISDDEASKISDYLRSRAEAPAPIPGG